MKKLICIAVIAVASLGAAHAQDYNWAVGLRLGGDTGGLSVKHKFDASHGIEGLLSGYWSEGMALTGLYERYVPAIGDGFHFYYGAGAHVGSWKRNFVLGADGIAGMEYRFADGPFALSFDWKPALNIVEKLKFRWADFAVGIRVTF